MAGTICIPGTFRPVLTHCGVPDPSPALSRLLHSLSLSVIQATCRVQSNFRLRCKRLRVSAPSGPSTLQLAALLQGQPPPPLSAGLPAPRRSSRPNWPLSASRCTPLSLPAAAPPQCTHLRAPHPHDLPRPATASNAHAAPAVVLLGPPCTHDFPF